jgi:hypothetical protein
MGITAKDVELLDEIIIRYRPKNVMELGAQNLYNQPKLPAPYAHEYYEPKGVKYSCIDLNGENNALKIDLGNSLIEEEKKVSIHPGIYDLVTDFVTSEHIGKSGAHKIESYYNCWKTKYDLCEVGGIILSENPKTGNWPGHGFNYIDVAFYHKLCNLLGAQIIHIEEHAAMGNVTDGWNVICIFIKPDREFISLEEFKTLGVKTS